MGAPVAKFFADRGTHLAAMIAYFALVSFFPLLFLTLSMLGFLGRADESSYVVRELELALPKSSVSSIVAVVREIQENAAALGAVGAVVLVWSSLGLFSALESAFNIVYGRPNRSFLRGKALGLAFLLALLVVTFVGLLAASFGIGQLRRHAPGVIGDPVVAYALPILASAIAVFAFLAAAYYLLTNERQAVRDVLPGAIAATAALELTFQALPVYLHESRNVPAAQAFGGPVILLVWMYLMANLIVLGAEVNWWLSRRREHAETRGEEAAGLA